MWISFIVPLAVLLAALLLQRLESALLGSPERVERTSEHPTARTAVDAVGSPVPAADPPLALVPDPPARRPRRTPRSPVVRATA